MLSVLFYCHCDETMQIRKGQRKTFEIFPTIMSFHTSSIASRCFGSCAIKSSLIFITCAEKHARHCRQPLEVRIRYKESVEYMFVDL